MAKGRIGRKLRKSHLYTFCLYQSPNGKGGQSVGGPGFSRIVHCNGPVQSERPFKYRSNDISTTKYSFITFLPKALYEQFNRVANLYFLGCAIASVTPLSPFSPLSMIAPLAFVVGLSMAKEALEDWKRFMQDREVNSRKVKVHKGEGTFGKTTWEKVQVGDVVRVEKDQFFPADLLLVSSNYEDGICYVETMNLDGETNLKAKRALEVTLDLDEDEDFRSFKGMIKCEDPNPSLYTFVGNLEYNDQVYALDPSQILLRDSKLRNTAYIYGIVIFTGHDSKVMMNSTKSPSKRSRIEKKMDYIIYVLFSVLLVISLISSLGFAVEIKYSMPEWWFLQPREADNFYNPGEPVTSGISHMVTALMLYGYLLPISLYVSIEVVKVLQASFINQDIHMYDEETGIPAQARTSNLNEELGQVDTILSDKTGTLTCNQMDFLKCSIAGIAYGSSTNAVELAAEKQMANDLEGKVELDSVVSYSEKDRQSSIKGFNFEDNRLMNGNWLKEPTVESIVLFFRILAVCHTAIPELNDDTGIYTYEAESPDEGSFLVAAREFGFEFFQRTQSSVFVREKYTTEVKGAILKQINNGSQMIKEEKDPHAAFALIIDGKTLAYALEDDMKQHFLDLGVQCASVICCRVSPKQKALVTRLVKQGTGKTTLAIGDGANDVGMIQEADIGVGISGVEGMQAVMASDFSVAQFRFLERLLVVHGHWCYKRIAQMICYFFYKNIAFGLTLFYFEAFTGFSGQSIYDDWYMLLFNVVLTALPVISLGVLEQDVSSEVCLEFPAIYQQGPRNLFFDWYRILGWMGNGLLASLIIFFLNIVIFYNQAFRVGGQTADMAALGATMFTCIIWSVNIQIALTMSHFTWIQHTTIWGSIIAWYLFLAIYGTLPPSISRDAYKILVEALAPAPIFWTTTLLVAITCNLPYMVHIAYQRCFEPMDHHIIQEIKYYRKDVEDQHMWTRERSKARQKTKIGFTARVEAKIRQIRAMMHKKQ